MAATYPVGQRIKRISGLLERVDEYVESKHYSAVMELADGKVMLLGQNAIVELDDWPDDSVDMPMQVLDGNTNIQGCLISHIFILHKPGETLNGPNGPQLFLMLDYQRMMGVVPTQRGSVLHVETAMTSPLIRIQNTLAALNGEPLALDDLI